MLLLARLQELEELVDALLPPALGVDLPSLCLLLSLLRLSRLLMRAKFPKVDIQCAAGHRGIRRLESGLRLRRQVALYERSREIIVVIAII